MGNDYEAGQTVVLSSYHVDGTCASFTLFYDEQWLGHVPDFAEERGLQRVTLSARQADTLNKWHRFIVQDQEAKS